MDERDERLTTDDLAAGGDRGASPDSRAGGSEGGSTVASELRGGEGGRPVEGDERPAERDEARATQASEAEPLLAAGQTDDFRARWEGIQTGFVDEPRRAVEHADALVADLMQRLADSFSQERRSLEAQWDRGDDVSTEDLRVALQRYRSFFDRLLST